MAAVPVALFLFRRDFRLDDNPAWARACAFSAASGARLVPAFVFSDRQVLERNNPYFSAKAFAVMLSLLDALPLRPALTRLRAGGADEELLAALHASATPLAAVFFNRDVTPFARDRDARIEAWCAANGVPCDGERGGALGEGYTFWPCGSVLNRAGKPPLVFSAFERAVGGRRPPAALSVAATAVSDVRCAATPRAWRAHLADTRAMRALAAPQTGGFRAPRAGDAAALLAAVERGEHDGYGLPGRRDEFADPRSTLRASALLKFGALAPARLLAAARRRGVGELERQLLWREFYYHLAAARPELLSGERNAHVRPDRQAAEWGRPDAGALRSWTRGETGEPLVDAAMRQLRAEGWLHNRLRMVVATHLVKVLGQDWRAGERIFAGMLADYDPAQNSGGWQSVDAQMDARAIKASTQQRKHDKDGSYVAAHGK
jgi:deoxyribodipyrimidine photo-lyase